MGKMVRTMGIVFLLCAGSAAATEVAIQVVQHGGASDSVNTAVFLIEDELLNSFFSAGFIVTNMPAVVSGADRVLNLKLVDESAAVGAEYAVQINVYIDVAQSRNPETISLADITQVVWVATTIASGTAVEGTTHKPSALQNDERSIRQYASNVARQIINVL
ncbi:MAG: hypothetical protein IJ191_07075 [Treponema sp.]|nr:hypothetical protein [Treponema sp.]